MAETLEKEDKKADSIEFYKQASSFLAPPKTRTQLIRTHQLAELLSQGHCIL